jgi:hypothetical protein
MHCEVTGRLYKVVTQMDFDGEPLNDKDRLCHSAWDQSTLITPLQLAPPELGPEARIAVWDSIIPRG